MLGAVGRKEMKTDLGHPPHRLKRLLALVDDVVVADHVDHTVMTIRSPED